MSTDDLLAGIGLVVVLAVGSQLVARRARIPAIVVLLPVGFVAGIATDDVHPDVLLGDLYQPFVSVAVSVILFEAGLRLSFRGVPPRVRPVVAPLIVVGVVVTWFGVALTVALLFDDVDRGVALLIGAILVVSGPTVVLPMLAFIRPPPEVRSLLKWEGVLVDPLGALLGVAVFHMVSSGTTGGTTLHPHGEMAISLAVGALVGAAGAGVLWLLVREVQKNAPRQTVAVILMVLVGAVVAADLLRDEAGLVSATVMGIILANQRRIDLALTQEFEETLVQMLVGVLFVLIAASVSPDEVRAVLPEAIALVAVMALVIRPLATALATWRSSFTLRERAFVAWLAPRGIVAGATASAFGVSLTQAGIAGGDEVLPIAFVAIFGTVVLYGLTGPPVARALGLAGTARLVVLVVSGHAWARDLAAALARSGVAVRMWVGPAAEQTAARAAGLDADRGRMMIDAVNREVELEEITDAVLLTQSDDFNAVAAAELRDELGHGHVYRVAPDPEAPDLLPPTPEPGILGDRSLTFAELDRRVAAGARIVSRPAADGALRGDEAAGLPLFVVGAGGRLSASVDGRDPVVRPGDTVIALTDAEGGPG